MDKALAERVWERAGGICEYCHLQQAVSRLRFHVEHIVARQHEGLTEVENLAIACPRCNLHQGPNLAGIDPVTGRKVWLLAMNAPEMIEIREALLEQGAWENP